MSFVGSFAELLGGAGIFAAEEPNKIFFPGDINEFYWGSLAFLIVMAFMAWKVLPSVKKMMRGQTEKISTELEEARQARETTETQTNEVRSRLGDISQDSDKIMAEAKESASKLEKDLTARAQDEAAEIVRRAESDADLLHRQAMEDLQTEMGVWVTEAAELLVAETLSRDQSLNSALVEEYIQNQLQTSGGAK